MSVRDCLSCGIVSQLTRIQDVHVVNSPERCFAISSSGPLVISGAIVDDSETVISFATDISPDFLNIKVKERSQTLRAKAFRLVTGTHHYAEGLRH